MVEFKVTECPYYLVSRATLVVTAALKRGLAEAGMAHVRPAYLGVLMSLWQEDGVKVVELGRRAADHSAGSVVLTAVAWTFKTSAGVVHSTAQVGTDCAHRRKPASLSAHNDPVISKSYVGAG